jgi:hypothetical protein
VNDVDRWIYFDGPEPESVRPLLDALREVETPRPTREHKARVLADFLETLDARLERVTESRVEVARGRAPALASAAPAAPFTAPVAPRSVDEVHALALGQDPLGFEAWAALSIRFLGARAEEKLEVLGARRLTLEAWTRIDDDYLRMLSADLRAGRTERPALYAATCTEEMARRTRASPAPEPPEENALAPRPADVRAQAPFSGTGDAVELPAALWQAMGKLPFKAAAAGPGPAPAAQGRELAKTKPMAVMRSGLGETLPLDGDALQKVVAAVPFAGSPGGVGIVYFPGLTVQQYVSLRADLAARPEWASETLRRYGVPSEASRRALEEHWQEQVAARPELRVELEAAVATYMTWLAGLAK